MNALRPAYVLQLTKDGAKDQKDLKCRLWLQLQLLLLLCLYLCACIRYTIWPGREYSHCHYLYCSSSSSSSGSGWRYVSTSLWPFNMALLAALSISRTSHALCYIMQAAGAGAGAGDWDWAGRLWRKLSRRLTLRPWLTHINWDWVWDCPCHLNSSIYIFAIWAIFNR